MSTMRLILILLLTALVGSAHAAVENITVQSEVELKPGQSQTVTIETNEDTEVGWQTLQAAPCTTDCVQAVDKSGGYEHSIATRIGASMVYKPVNGKITIEYKNQSAQDVTIDIHRVQRTCEASACALIDHKEDGRWTVFKIDEFHSIETSADRSYSVISGVTTAGKSFTVKAVWWTDNPDFMFGCAKFIQAYLDEKTPKEDYSPYVIAGMLVEGTELVLRSVDTCTPKAPNFGAPQENVF
jgi:hypothetical protein